MYNIEVRNKEEEDKWGSLHHPIYKQWAVNSWLALGPTVTVEQYQNTYNVKMNFAGNMVESLSFNNETDATMFLLRWS